MAHAERQLTSRHLPAPTTRWVASRKATLVRSVEAGLLSLEDAYSRYAISVDEFLLWQHRLARQWRPRIAGHRIQRHRGIRGRSFPLRRSPLNAGFRFK